MLTRDLLVYTVRKGTIRPRFVDTENTELIELASDLVAIWEVSVGETKSELDEAMRSRALRYRHPKVGRGLVKLLDDRTELQDPGGEALAFRSDAFSAAMDALSEIEADDPVEVYEAKIEARLGSPLSVVREALHADLPGLRPVASIEPLTARGLLERYNLALAQGLVMYAGRLDLVLDSIERPEVRRLLRWMRFCRLVAEVGGDEGRCLLGVEGPAALFEGAKSYGLQLASFMTAVPALPRWGLRAEVRLPHRSSARLELNETDPLVSTVSSGPGHVPPEVRAVLERFELPGWSVDLAPSPRATGARGLAVPDFALIPDKGEPVVVELFHRWHRGALERRLGELEAVPDRGFRLGVERALARDPDVESRVRSHPQAFLFRGFPSMRVLKGLVEGVENP